MEQETGIRSLYDQFFRGYGVEISLFSLALLSNWTHNQYHTYINAVMRLILKSAVTLVLVAIAAFSCFGFMASAENGPIGITNPTSWLYGGTFVVCVVADVVVWRANPRWPLTLILVTIAAFCCFSLVAGGVEPSGALGPFRWLYGVTLVACGAAIVAVWVVKGARRRA